MTFIKVLLLVAVFGAVSFAKGIMFKDIVCPDWPQGRSYLKGMNRTCNRDSDCRGIQLCCYDGEDKHCTDPVPAYIGKAECPHTPGKNVNCTALGYSITRRCHSDDDCSRTEACCAIETCQWGCWDKKVQRQGKIPVMQGSWFNSMRFSPGENATLHCSAKGEGLRTVTWYRNNVPMHRARAMTNLSADGQRISSTLTIPNIQRSDRDWYECAVKTDQGRHAEKSFSVDVRLKNNGV